MTNGEKMVWAAVFAKRFCDLNEAAAFARYAANNAVRELRKVMKNGKAGNINDEDMQMVFELLED